MLSLEGVNGFTQIPFTTLPQTPHQAVDFASHLTDDPPKR